MAVLFFSGWETGDNSEWGGGGNTNGTQAIDSTNSHGGKYSWKISTTNATAPNLSNHSAVFAAATTLFVRFYLYLDVVPANLTFANLVELSEWDSATATVAMIGLQSDASGNPSLWLKNVVSGLQIGSAFAVSTATWHLIELKIITSATVGQLEMKVDGIVAATSAANLNTGTTGIVSGYVTTITSATVNTITVHFDDVFVNTSAYIGPGECLARQFTATTPNYNNWTKSTGTTVDTCWDNTPFIAGVPNCTSSTSAAIQTGVCIFGDTVSVGATGHGTDVIVSTDTINAAKIGWVGKTASTTTADSTVFRTPAGGAGVDTTTVGPAYTTSDAYLETIFTTPTTAQILNCEAGIKHAANSILHTVEDVWLMVDFTANRAGPIRLPGQRRRTPHIKPTRPMRTRPLWKLPLSPHADRPYILRQRGQKRRIPIIKPTRPVHNRLIDERLITAPHADRPYVLRLRGQKRRIPTVKSTKPLRDNLTKQRIPPAPTATLPLSVRHPRGQARRIAQVRAKKIVRSSIELRIPPRPFSEPPAALRHAAQRKRIPKLRAKRTTRSSVELRIPPLPALATPARRPGQRKRIPKLSPKRALRDNLTKQLIPPAPPAIIPPTIRHQSQRRRVPIVKAKRRVRSSTELRIPRAPVPEASRPIFTRKQARRLPQIKAKRPLRSNIAEQLIPPAPVPQTPPAIRRRGQLKRTPRTRVKHVVRARGLALGPVALSALHRGRVQPKRTPKIRAKKPLRSNLVPAPEPLQPAFIGQKRRQRKPISRVRAKHPLRNSVQLRIPPAPTPQAPAPIFARKQVKRSARIRSKRPLRANLTLQVIPPAPAPLVPPAILPRTMAAQKQRRRIPHTKPKKPLRGGRIRSSVPAPAAEWPYILRKRGQTKRIAPIKPKHGTRKRLLPTPTATSALRPSKIQPKRITKARTKTRSRSTLQLSPRIPPATLSKAVQKKRSAGRARAGRPAKPTAFITRLRAAPPVITAQMAPIALVKPQRKRAQKPTTRRVGRPPVRIARPAKIATPPRRAKTRRPAKVTPQRPRKGRIPFFRPVLPPITDQQPRVLFDATLDAAVIFAGILDQVTITATEDTVTVFPATLDPVVVFDATLDPTTTIKEGKL